MPPPTVGTRWDSISNLTMAPISQGTIPAEIGSLEVLPLPPLRRISSCPTVDEAATIDLTPCPPLALQALTSLDLSANQLGASSRSSLPALTSQL